MGDLSKSKTAYGHGYGDVQRQQWDERSGLLRRSRSVAVTSKERCDGKRFEDVDLLCPKSMAVANTINGGGMIGMTTNVMPLVTTFRRRIDRRIAQWQKKPEVEQGIPTGPEDEIPGVVWAVYALAFFVMMTMTTVSPTLLLYTNYRGWTTETNLTFFASLSLANVVVPVIGNIVVGNWLAATSVRTAMMGMLSITILGLLLMITAESKYLFLAGYTLLSLNTSNRIARLTFLSEIVPAKQKTFVMANHALATPLGAMLGPICWLALVNYQGEAGPWTFIPGVMSFRLNRFTLVFLLTLLVSLGMMVLVWIYFPGANSRDPEKSGTGRSAPIVGPVQLSYNGAEETVDSGQFRYRVFRYFCMVMFLINFSAGFFQVAFQPILVDYFKVTESSMGLIFETISVLAIVPPLLVALLSRFLEDRQLMLVGICAKMLGMLLYCFPFGKMHVWQPVVGNILIIKASIFFFTSALSLFTKILGPLSGGAWIGILSSVAAVGPAVAQLLALRLVLTIYGTYWYFLFCVPAVLGFFLVAYPWFYKYLDPNREFIQQLHTAVVHP
uniref:Major facilitator superfamily (MFS) profile domain-containing protein n=1 Tax=Rhodosorus marinus TaxID=101924 RepID=A0A7S0G3Y8_9RHOD